MTLEIKNYEIELTKLVPTEKNPRQILRQSAFQSGRTLRNLLEPNKSSLN